MKLTIPAWIEREFSPDSRPTVNTVRRWARNGKIPTTRVGKQLYIDASVTFPISENPTNEAWVQKP